MKVLLLEDYRDSAIALKALLELDGYEVDCARTLAAALDCLHDNAYDLALIDLMLPDSAELETFDAIHKAAPDLPVVILSALDEASIAVEAVKRGASSYLVKPVGTDMLRDKMIQAIARP